MNSIGLLRTACRHGLRGAPLGPAALRRLPAPMCARAFGG
eukprot:CAMPEP_0170411386 /NCGR_PEP_ID=MMETSP0117_2-20130122/30397_1 /TAXON_ID=400756 /ORGANISM="Durinskia baltica, Strain CSIRO CS-38" /LENGTH=39 /DNA_ID= /DNA_START= /DNA_END= /DNA_ORIENTATION=